MENGRGGMFTGCVLEGYVTGCCCWWWTADKTGCARLDAGILYDAVGAGRVVMLGALVVFCRAMFASASRIDEPLEAAAAGAAAGTVVPLLCFDPIMLAGGLPGGVVEAATRKGVRTTE
jgi:hypothetical protein